MELEKETALVETILFLECEPATEKALSNISRLSEEVVRQCIEKLKEKYLAENSGIELTMITGGWSLVPKQEFWEIRLRYSLLPSGKRFFLCLKSYFIGIKLNAYQIWNNKRNI